MDEARLFVERFARTRDPDCDLDAIALVSEPRIVTLGVLAFPEAFVATPRLKVPGQRIVEPSGGGTDVDNLGGVRVADDVDARLVLQVANPLRVRLAAGADAPIRETSVPRESGLTRIADDLPAAHRDSRIDLVRGPTTPQLKVEMPDLPAIEWTEADSADHLTGANTLLRSGARSRRHEHLVEMRVERAGFERPVIDDDGIAVRRLHRRPDHAVSGGEHGEVVRHDEKLRAVRRPRLERVGWDSLEHDVDAAVAR